jgi:hypothetical protein
MSNVNVTGSPEYISGLSGVKAVTEIPLPPVTVVLVQPEARRMAMTGIKSSACQVECFVCIVLTLLRGLKSVAENNLHS